MFERVSVGRAGGLAACLVLLLTSAAAADGTAWLPEPGSGYVSVSLVHQSADEFYAADRKRPTPGAADLSQGTVWINANYALADGWAVDLQTGWARSEFVTGPGIPTMSASFRGMTDASVGITRRLTDETMGAVPSIAVRLGGIASGDYETGQINSLGDGGSGYEFSAIVGRFFAGRLGLSCEVGQRYRESDIPSEWFANLAALWLVGGVVTIGLDYRLVDSRGELDIGAPDFTPARFPELDEDHQAIGVRAFFNVGGFGVSTFHSRVIDGRNTAASGVFGLAVSRSFGAL
ncbi:MAG: hypothetical protein OXG82_08385 [Gammaproteobacteria bacterium]|nr:hypothetical protein [Gammaproteobacteria bacterium]